ncbi:MAG: response regulator transcription factor [Candidatus Obscuribacter sp.]|nr:response regulator transcription factor [Candidatus Obscuribacter sp.]MBK9276589.1 response regulator transcription factor [Candidatus Obscuribacter sp.]
MAKILLVEDDKELCTIIEKWFLAERHTIEIVHDGEDAIYRMLGGFYDLVILDLTIPKIDGIEVCRRYRSAKGISPIIMLTGRNLIVEKTVGFEAGADDYLTKPFSVKELSLRVGALLRRPPDYTDMVLRAGRLTLDTAKHTVHLDGKQLNLPPTDYSLLEFLMRNANKVFSSEQLIDRVWHTDKSPGDNAVRSAIKRLRQAIKDDEGLIIENIKKIGYRLNA